MPILLSGLDSQMKPVSDDIISDLQAALRGDLIRQGEPGYDTARALWNGMVDRRPGLVVRAIGTPDIQAVVNFVRNNALRISVKGGGHQIGGFAVAEGALLLDLSLMRSVHVDAQARTARVGAGALLGDIDAETQLYGLAVPTGVNSTTGIAGLTLGGGFGWISRKFGMTIDNLVSANVVTADGQIRRASTQDNPELFWALRGGGGNFGVVSSFEFSLSPVGPEVVAGLIVHPLEDAPTLLRELEQICNNAPDELTVWAVMRKAPPLPFLPEDWHGRDVLVLALCYAGDTAEAENAIAGLKALGTPVAVAIGPQPFAGWQAAFDPLLTPGERNYWKSHDLLGLSAKTIDEIVTAVKSLPDPQSEVFIAHVGGAAARIAEDATAYPQRKTHFIANIHTRWSDAAKDETCIAWARGLFDRLTSEAAGSVYVNFMPEDDTDRIDGAYGGNLDRLRKAKAQYDPDNLFRVNHNILPEGDA